MKRITTMILTGILSASLLAGCASQAAQPSAPAKSNFNTSKDITVISREEGSGTRGAFIELMKVEEKDASGKKADKTTKEAVIASKTDVVLTNVAGDNYAIGYISLGSLNNTVKALKVDGVAASAENVKNKTYKVSRPFNIATKGATTGVAKDFIDYILSADGQKVIANGGYIKINESAPAYTGSKPSGKIVVGGSSSVTPIMEKLQEAYLAINPNATIEIQMSDSTAGMTGAIQGTCNIGMASRELTDTEKTTLTPISIALDGIAMIVNNNNTLDNITSADVKSIYTGTATKWNEIIK